MTARRDAPGIRLLGDPALLSANGSIRALERRAAGLLALVALEPGVTRARAAALLWPDSDDARLALRQQIARFRKIFGAELLHGTDALFVKEGVSVDALTTDGGTLLGELAFDDCEAFAAWLEQQRMRRHGSATDQLGQRLSQAEASGDLEAATRLAEQLVEADADSEAHHRTLMRLHYLRGDVAQAQRAYARLVRHLKTRFDAAPSSETEQLARALRTALTAPQTATAVTRPVPATVLRPPRMIGRQRERAALETAWHGGRVALLIGEPGLGKTRLLAEFAAGRRLLTAQGRPGDAGVPYATLSRLLRTAFERVPIELPAPRRSELSRLLPELAPAVPLPAEGQRLMLRGAVEAVLAQVLQDGAAHDGIIVDDLHFADDASVEMLQALMAASREGEALAGMRWLLAQRPGEGGGAAAGLRVTLEEAQALDAVTLAPLSAEEMAELIDSLGLPELDSAQLAAPLTRHTGGNPLYALETLKQGLGSGLLRQGRLPTPVNVGALIERRLKQLPERALALARVAAIAGVDFSIALAEQVMGTRAVELADAWADLEAAQVLRDGAFAHDLVYDAALRSIPAPIATHLHSAVAVALQAQQREAARIAQHWLAAGRDADAADALDLAAAQALATGRAAEAGRFLRDAAAACDRLGQPDRAFDLLFQAADALSLSVPIDEFEPLADELLARARSDAQRASALLAQIHVRIEREQYEAARAPAAQALDAARRAQRRDLEAEILIAYSHFCRQANDFAGAVEAIEQAIALLRAEQRHESVATKLLSLAGMQMNLGRVRDGLHSFTQAHKRCQALGIKEAEPVLMSLWGLCSLLVGDGAQTRKLTAQAQNAVALSDPAVGINDGHLADLIVECTQSWLLLGETATALRSYTDLGAARLILRFEHHTLLREAQAMLMLALGRADLAAPALAALRAQADRKRAVAVADLLQMHYALADGGRFWSATADLTQAVPGVVLQCQWLPLLAVHAPPERALREIDRLLQPMRAEQAMGAVVALLAAQALVLARSGRVAEAAIAGAECAALALTHAATVDPLWVALACAETFSRCGVPARAAPLLERAAVLVDAQSALLPDEYRDAYRQRNPLVRTVLEVRARGDSGALRLPQG